MTQMLKVYHWQSYDSSEFFSKLCSFLNDCNNQYALLRNQKKICSCLNNFINKYIADPTSLQYSQNLSKAINILNWRLAQFAKNGIKKIFQKFELLLARVQKYNFNPRTQFNHFEYSYSSVNKPQKKNYLINDLSEPIYIKKKQTNLEKLYKNQIKELFTFKDDHMEDNCDSEQFLLDVAMIKKMLGPKNCLGCCEFLYEGQQISHDDYHDIICYKDLSVQTKDLVCGINALANSRGGIILIGIKDNKVCGIKQQQKSLREELNRLQEQLNRTCTINDKQTLIQQNVIFYSVIERKRKKNNGQACIEVETDKKVEIGKKVIGIQVPYMQKVSYITMDRQGKIPLYECYYKLETSNGLDSIFEYTKNDIYEFILRKYAQKRKNVVHYNLQCHRQDSRFIIQEKSGPKTDQNDQKGLFQEEMNQYQAPKFRYGVQKSILIIKNDKGKQQETLKSRKQEALKIIKEKDSSLVCQDIYTKIQDGGGNYNSRVYFIEHKKSSKQLARFLKTRVSYAKFYEVSKMILITDETVAKFNINTVKDKYKILVNQEYRSFRSGKCNIKVNEDINQKWGFLEIQQSQSQALYILVHLRAQGVKCVFAREDQVEIQYDQTYSIGEKKQ